MTQKVIQDFAEALRQEMVPGSALERAAIAEYIDVECQRLKLRLVRDQAERAFAAGHLWTLLCRAMLQQHDAKSVATTAIEAQAEELVKRWRAGHSEARDEILNWGIDIEEAVLLSTIENIAVFGEIERFRERLADRARLLMLDIERSANFMAKRKGREISDAEILS
ncbi:hypothetical protein [Tabrizicola sp. M-4]|uniref:hypothetical protein n=1 Tax=Tabrizicola sp. M-4 TaxID=3055847 RepID=UPI003DA8EA1C